ncbi:hypothetical protein GRI43_10115 [Altererythrobacter luteolus]|uniref:MYXO-CTERM domain-containing protein n=1 Tax=Pontixanthobacter luteolus TaxID=295089 RepID=A0A6I4V3S3_9SPHN|nr:hypothetical protein [Pontixanthobacter luteolus]MXP47736.1 hypothetical protein [Pontixanthobacter luteolus]
MRTGLSSVVALSMLFAVSPATAELRPEAASFAIVSNDDEVGLEEPGWFWVGAGILLGLGFLVLLSDSEPNSPR